MMSDLSKEDLTSQLVLLQRQLAELHKELQARQNGDGAIAQDQSVAAGAEGVAIGGNVYGNVTFGAEPPKDEEADMPPPKALWSPLLLLYHGIGLVWSLMVLVTARKLKR